MKLRLLSCHCRFAMFVALLVAVLGLAACGGDSSGTSGGDETTAATNDAGSTEPIKIGAAMGMSGIMAGFDGPVAVGMELAVDELNAEREGDKRPLELEIVDFKSDRAQSAVAATQLLSKGAEVLVTSADFDFAAGAAFTAKEQDVVAISPAAGSPKFGKQGIGPLAFTMAAGSPNQGTVLAEYAYAQGYRKAFVMLDTFFDFNKATCGYFEERWAELEGTSIVGSDTFVNDDPSVSTQIDAIRGASPAADFIQICSQPPGGASAIRQIRAAGIDLPIQGSDAFDGEAWLDAVPNLSDFTYVTASNIFGDDPNPEVNRVVKELTERLGERPSNSLALYGYATIQAIAAGVDAAGTTDGPELAAAFEEFSELPTIVGPVSFNSEEHMDLTRPLAVMQVNNGKHEFIEYRGPERKPELRFE